MSIWPQEYFTENTENCTVMKGMFHDFLPAHRHFYGVVLGL